MKQKTKLTPQIAGLYLGCEVEIAGEWFQPNKPIFAKLVTVYQNGYVDIENDQGKKIERKIGRIKLILRLFEDMTDKEYNEWEALDIPPDSDPEEVIINEAKRTLWLIDKRFDLFGLIESGGAIRKQI